MKRSALSAIFKFATVLWATAIGGFLGAQTCGTVGALFFVADRVDAEIAASESAAHLVQTWSHRGWYVGSLLFLMGSVTGCLRFKGSEGLRARIISSKRGRESTAKSTNRNKGRVWEWCIGFGLFGGMLGAFVGGSLLILWFWLAVSPFAPPSWNDTISVAGQPLHPTAPASGARQSQHPIALKLLLLPALGGLATGAAVGTVLGLCQNSKPECE